MRILSRDAKGETIKVILQPGRKFFLIEIRLGQIQQLFNSLDASPFFEKDLDDEAKTFIVQSVKEFPLPTPLKLVFYLPQSAQEEATQVLPEAIHHYFSYRHHMATQKFRHILQQGRISLVIGLTFLGICIGFSRLISLFGDVIWVQILQEGLLIIGWVAMWRPLEIFLYDWCPIRHRQQVFQKLSQVAIDIRPL